jgi:type IX secretion system PorP/SprF family membrane protein
MRRLLVYLFCLCNVLVYGQDPQFSIFYGTPMSINPAYTGNFNGNFRVSAQYRDQWNSVLAGESTAAFRTAVVNLEARTNRGIDEHDFVAVGINGYYDIAGQSNFSNTAVGINLAYRKSLDEHGDHFLAVGGNFGMIQKKINLNGLTWGNQWNGLSYDAGIDAQELTNLDDNLISYDISAGLAWGYNIYGTRNRFFAGLGVLHINQPRQSFYLRESQDLAVAYPMRINANFGAGIQLGSSMDFLPKVLYARQGASQQILAGADFRFLIDPADPFSNSFYIGALTRVVGGDANIKNSSDYNLESMIASVRFDFNDFEVGAAYDFTVSQLKNAARFQGGFELYLNYVFKLQTSPIRKIYCPKF